ncbi:TPA: DUF551 domain-containing protein [Klebsiella pneumoniae]|nr:DUF551 domain-containing protein [Klebsiella pneumoniae]HCM6387734.1 DUF551 domain-containing protein [Klebsiella pneumoniae]HCM6475126.1 DUF551 domain-containing protein [Klebsiella pneumoniae]HCM7557233.1 DUF551 domain-containing protein [Klebsiella pneumoniae]
MKFEEWLSQQNGVIEVDCGCVTTEAFYHWMRVAYEAGNSPVVPDDVSIFEAAIEECKTCDSIDEHAWNHGVLVVMAKYESCRAAMLAAAPHDTPALNSVQSVVTVPGKWIPVSERMPEVGVKVLCFPAEDEPIHAVFNGQLWLQDISWSNSDEPIDNVITCNVTHWVPLPAAPQEVK